MNNIISKDQWELIVKAVYDHVNNSNYHDDVIYLEKTYKDPQTRHCVYDNYDRYDSPGLDFVITDGCDNGRLTVFNRSEMKYAPITFEKGLYIANNFFNVRGSDMAEEIVCDYVIDGNPLIDLWNQEDQDRIEFNTQEDWDDYVARYPLPNEGPINDEDWDCENGRPFYITEDDM